MVSPLNEYTSGQIISPLREDTALFKELAIMAMEETGWTDIMVSGAVPGLCLYKKAALKPADAGGFIPPPHPFYPADMVIDHPQHLLAHISAGKEGFQLSKAKGHVNAVVHHKNRQFLWCQKSGDDDGASFVRCIYCNLPRKDASNLQSHTHSVPCLQCGTFVFRLGHRGDPPPCPACTAVVAGQQVEIQELEEVVATQEVALAALRAKLVAAGKELKAAGKEIKALKKLVPAKASGKGVPSEASGHGAPAGGGTTTRGKRGRDH